MATDEDVTPEVVTLNVAEDLPTGIVTLEGATAFSLLDNKATTKPPDGAGPVRAKVALEDEPPATELGFRLRLLKVGGVIVNFADADAPFAVAVMVGVMVVATGEVWTVNVTEVEAATTVMLAGTTAAALFELKLTFTPPDGAGPSRAIVPVELMPPTSVAGAKLTFDGTGGMTTSVAVTDELPDAAVIVADVTVATADVAIVNVADEEPAATVTVGGVIALALLEVNVTTVPLFGAGAFSVTVPVEDLPPTRLVGETVRPFSPNGSIVSAALADAPPDVAAIIAVVAEPTVVVETVNVALVAPGGTMTDAGVEAAEFPLARLTMSPTAGAAY